MVSMKILIVLALLAILASLGSALFFMMRRPGGSTDSDSNPEDNRCRSRQMARALTLRVLISVLLFVALLVSWKLGYIQPTGLPITR